MSGLRYTEEFSRDAVAQVTERGYSVLEVSRLLGSAASRYMTGKSNITSQHLSAPF